MTNRAIQLSFFFLVFGIALVLGFFIFKPYLNVLVMAATFAVIFYPLYQKLNKRWNNKYPSLASLVTVVIASLIIFVPLSMLSAQVYRETTQIYSHLNEAQQNEQAPLGEAEETDNQFILELREKVDAALTQVTLNIDRYAQQTLGWILDNAGKLSQSVAHVGLAIFIWILSFYYFLRDGHRLRELFIVFSPLSDRYDVEIVNRVVGAVKSVVGGSLIVAVLQGIACGIGLWIFGVPAPAIWGAVSVIAALVPTIGTALVMLPAIGYLFLLGHNVPAVGLLIWALVVVNLIDNVLRPKLIERGINVHPLTILLSVLGGIAFFGPVGFLTGPIIISLLSEFLQIYNKMVLHHEDDALKGNRAA
jgi:predicted PurR-regulated permease PerM